MKIAFLTEMGFSGKIPRNHPNMRTEFAWMCSLEATHFPLSKYNELTGFDVVFIIFPKGRVYLSAEGSKLVEGVNPVSNYFEIPLVDTLKKVNGKVYYVQEGPHWWWNDYSVKDQIGFYNFIVSTDGIFAHNESDVDYYKGMFPLKKVEVIKSLIIDDLIKNTNRTISNKTIIGGNFARWYGGFESYIVASDFELPIWAQTSHAMRDDEPYMENLNHLPRLMWDRWMSVLSEFKYAVHLMPTVAAGTFSLNCAYFGIPVIGNEKVDTQRILFDALSVDVSDIKSARIKAEMLKNDKEFYNYCSVVAKENYNEYYSEEVWKYEMLNKIL